MRPILFDLALPGGLGRVAELWRGGLAYYGGLAAAFPVLWLWGRR